jgi:hypothetical protein
MSLRKGQAIDYTCQFRNTEDRQVRQGATTKDEMCMFLGTYYPRNEELEACGISTAGAGATFIGTGTADGKTTIECLNKHNSDEDPGNLYGCVQDSCPAIAEQVTGHLTCQITATDEKGACGAPCGPQGSEDACGACMNATCGVALNALATAKCN